MPKSIPSPADPRHFRIAAWVSACSREAVVYGACVSAVAENIVRDSCAKELAALLQCVNKAVSAAKLINHQFTEVRKMKVKRLKRAQNVLAFYRHNYGLTPPYHLLVDGTFCNAALEQQLNIREQVGKYLGDDDCRYWTTDCVLRE